MPRELNHGRRAFSAVATTDRRAAQWFIPAAAGAGDSAVAYRFFADGDDHYVRRDDYAPAFRIGKYAFDNIAGVGAGRLLAPADDTRSWPAAPDRRARGPRRRVSTAAPDPALGPRGDGVIVAAMPELPDITVYLEALERHVVGRELRDFVLRSPFLLRTAEPDPRAVTF